MNNSMEQITAAAMALERRMEFLANNLANVNTVGFKEDRPIFDVVDTQGNSIAGDPALSDTAPSEAIIPIGYLNTIQGNPMVFSGVKTDFSQGALQHTGNSLDLAINGRGFFAVMAPDGIRYTRAGGFLLNNEGIMVNRNGFIVLGQSGEITIGAGEILIDEKGNIRVDGNSVDRLLIVEPPSEDTMKKVGGSLLEASDAPLPEKDSDEVNIIQGFLEASNVNVIREMTMLINVSRAYETYQKVIHSLNEVLSESVNEISRLT